MRYAFVVVSGNGSCANISDLHDEWVDLEGRKFLYLGIPSGCIPNNSIWTYSDGTNNSWESHYRYKGLDNTNEITIDASYEIKATYLRDHAGIRALECK